MFADGLSSLSAGAKPRMSRRKRKEKRRKRKPVSRVAEEEEPMADWEKFVMQVCHAIM